MNADQLTIAMLAKILRNVVLDNRLTDWQEAILDEAMACADGEVSTEMAEVLRDAVCRTLAEPLQPAEPLRPAVLVAPLRAAKPVVVAPTFREAFDFAHHELGLGSSADFYAVVDGSDMVVLRGMRGNDVHVVGRGRLSTAFLDEFNSVAAARMLVIRSSRM